MNFENIIDQYDKLLNSNQTEIIQKAEQLAEEDYFDKAIIRIMGRLFPNQ
jgi:hypothetical protein